MSGRRGFLAYAGTSALAVASARHVSSNPTLSAVQRGDADLLALCAEFHRANAAVDALGDDFADEDMNDAMQDRYDISDRIILMVPSTPAGIREKARVALVMFDESDRRDDSDADVRFADAVLRAVAGVVA